MRMIGATPQIDTRTKLRKLTIDDELGAVAEWYVGLASRKCQLNEQIDTQLQLDQPQTEGRSIKTLIVTLVVIMLSLIERLLLLN